MRLKMIVIALLVAIIVPVSMWKSGFVQCFAVERTVRSVLGAHASVKDIKIAPTLQIEELKIFPDSQSSKSGAAFAAFDGITVEYDLFPGEGRRISKIHIRAAEIFADAADPEKTNFQFLVDYIGKDRSDKKGTWIPGSVEIESLTLGGAWKGSKADVAGLEVYIKFRDKGDLDVTLTGEALTGSVVGELMDIDLEPLDLDEGTCEIVVRFRGQVIELEWSHKLPDGTLVEGRGTITRENDRVAVNVSDAKIVLASDMWIPVFNKYLGNFEVGYDRIEVEFPTLHWDSETGGLPTAEVRGYIRGLSVFDATSPVYDGSLGWDGRIFGGNELASELKVSLSQGLDFDTRFSSNDTGSSVTAEFAWWEKSAILETVPHDVMSGLEGLPFEQLHGRGELTWDDTSFAIVGLMQSVSTDESDPIDIDINLNGDFDNPSETIGLINAHVGDGNIHAKGTRDENDVYRADINIERVQFSPLVLLATGNKLPEPFTGFIDGTVKAERPAGSQHIKFVPSLVFSEMLYGKTSLDTVNFDGDMTMNIETRVASIENLVMNAENDSLQFNLKEATLDFDSGDMRGKIHFGADIELMAELAGVEGFYGTVEGASSVELVNGNYVMPFTFESDDIGYNDLALYETVFAGGGTLKLDGESSQWTSDKIVIRVGDGSEMSIENFVSGDTGMSGTSRFSSDLKLGIDMGYYKEINGLLEGKADWLMPKEGDITVQWETSTEIESILLKENAGSLSNLMLTAKGDYDQEIHGNGKFRAENMTAAGAQVHSLLGTITFVNDTMIINRATARIFNGTLTSDVEVQILEPGFPIKYAGSIKNIDLKLLTEEVKPPKTTMTGIANGTISAVYSFTDGLSSFALDTLSTSGFTLNRSLVEEYVPIADLTAGFVAKKAEKTLDKILGTAAQRPFETAILKVSLIDEAIVGVANLRSQQTKDYRGLNLNFELNIDKSALIASLQLLEESNLSNVTF